MFGPFFIIQGITINCCCGLFDIIHEEDENKGKNKTKIPLIVKYM